MSADLERASITTPLSSGNGSGSGSGSGTGTNTGTGSSSGTGGRALSANVRRLHNALNLLLSDVEREHFIHCLNVYHAKRNVFDLVQTLKVILGTPGKRQLLPMLRLVIPRSDQLLFDQYTSEGLYLKSDLLPSNGSGESFGDEGDSALQSYVSSFHEEPQPQPHSLGCAEDFSAASVAPHFIHGFVGDVRSVTLTRSRSHEGLGFSIRGGSEHGVGIYVSLVEPGSSAEREGLRVGDQIVTVNDMVFSDVTHFDAVKVLKGCKKLMMSVCSMGRIPGGYITNHVYSWVDPQGRSVSPPPDNQELNERQGPGMEEKTVNLNMDDGRSLGLMIRGGAEYGLGIYITGVDPGSAADIGALKVGDQILEVNGQSFITICHDEAVHILKTGRHLLIKVRDVGRLPHARTVMDETKWVSNQDIAETSATVNSSPVTNPAVNAVVHANVSSTPCSSRPSSARAPQVIGQPAAYRGAGPPGPQVSLEQQAYMLLTEPETKTMVYYLQEYQEGHIGVEPLTMALFELFNTHAKLSMLSEVRALVLPQDLELYDRLVLHREREAHQALHGGLVVLHPPGHCSYAARVIHDGGHTVATTDGVRTPNQTPPPFRAAPLQVQSRPSRETEACGKPSARMMQSGPSLLFSGPTQLHQDCLHKSLKSLPASHQSTPALADHSGSTHHTALAALHHTCQNFYQLPDSSHHFAHHFFHHPASHNRPSSGHHTCPGFLHHRDSSAPGKSSGCVKISSRSSSYEKSSILSKSASSSKAGSPMPSPHPTPHPSPCPSPCPSLITPAAPPCGSDLHCSPALTHRVIITDTNRLSADSRPQQRGATLSQLSDSGQTLSEDSGVDIAEAGGLSKDGSPRPSKNQRSHLDQPGAYAPPPGAARQSGSPVLAPTAIMVRVVKNANTLGIAIEGGANTRQPLPRIVTIQKGGSAHNCEQLRVGQVILEVNGISLRGREHKEAARIIAEAFKTKDKDHIDLLVVEPTGL